MERNQLPEDNIILSNYYKYMLLYDIFINGGSNLTTMNFNKLREILKQDKLIYHVDNYIFCMFEEINITRIIVYKMINNNIMHLLSSTHTDLYSTLHYETIYGNFKIINVEKTYNVEKNNNVISFETDYKTPDNRNFKFICIDLNTFTIQKSILMLIISSKYRLKARERLPNEIYEYITNFL